MAKRLWVRFIEHTDGKVWKILGLIVEAGIDAPHSIKPAVGMRIDEVKRPYGHRIAVIGNVDCSVVLPLLSERDGEGVRRYGRYPISEDFVREYPARDSYARIFGGRRGA